MRWGWLGQFERISLTAFRRVFLSLTAFRRVVLRGIARRR